MRRTWFAVAMCAVFCKGAESWSAGAAPDAPEVRVRDTTLSDSDRDRAAAELAVAPGGVQRLATLLQDPDPSVRFAAASGMMAIPSDRQGGLDIRKSIVTAMLPLQEHADAAVRMKALMWLSNGNAGRVPDAGLERALADADPLIRRQAMYLAGSMQLAPMRVVLALARAISVEADREARERGLASLDRFTGQLPEEAVATRQAALRWMRAEAASDRVAGLLAGRVIAQPDREMAEAVLKCLTDADPAVRDAAARFVTVGLSKRPSDPEAIELALRGVELGNPQVSSAVVSGHQAAGLWVAPLRARHAAASGEAKKQLGIALAALGEPSAASTADLAAELKSPSPERRREALRALSATGRDAASLDAVIELFTHDDQEFRTAAIDVLYQRFGNVLRTGTDRDRAAEEKWRPLVYGKRGRERADVYRQMGEAGVAVGPAVNWLREAVIAEGFTPEERAAAVEALGKVFRAAAAAE
jgi:hypothetical protein